MNIEELFAHLPATITQAGKDGLHEKHTLFVQKVSGESEATTLPDTYIAGYQCQDCRGDCFAVTSTDLHEALVLLKDKLKQRGYN